jgi:hypothetical protein
MLLPVQLDDMYFICNWNSDLKKLEQIVVIYGIYD